MQEEAVGIMTVRVITAENRRRPHIICIECNNRRKMALTSDSEVEVKQLRVAILNQDWWFNRLLSLQRTIKVIHLSKIK